jgi:uncharacterized membrane protein YqiK
MISEMTTETTRGVVDKAIAIAVLVVLVVCGVVLFWLRKRRAGNGKQ